MAVNFNNLTDEQVKIFQDLLKKYHYASTDTINKDIPARIPNNPQNDFIIKMMIGISKRRHIIEEFLTRYPWIIDELKHLSESKENSNIFIYDNLKLTYKDLCRKFDSKYALISREASRIIYTIKDIWNLQLYQNGQIHLYNDGKLIDFTKSTRFTPSINKTIVAKSMSVNTIIHDKPFKPTVSLIRNNNAQPATPVSTQPKENPKQTLPVISTTPTSQTKTEPKKLSSLWKK